MSWIRTIPYEESQGTLRKLYDRVKGPDGEVDNILQLHGLRPHTLQGHMSLYKSVLHHTGNSVPKWLLETIGVYVSILNRCGYCVEHHFAGLERLLDDDDRAAAIRSALEGRCPETAFPPREAAALRYAERLTVSPHEMGPAELEPLREHGWSDDEILEINQVAAYFAYANRTVLGLGATTDGDTIGLSPHVSDDPENWSHA